MAEDDRDLFKMLAPERLTIAVDVGANPIDGDPPYKALFKAGLCMVVGFEPQPEALAKLNKVKSDNEIYLQLALGDGGKHILHVTSSDGMTSLLEPDPAQLELLNLFPEFGQVVARFEVETHKLDDVEGLDDLDFAKFDIQGGELMVLENGRKAMSNVVALQIEMSFLPLYKNQPSFGDIDRELRAQGFMPHCFASVKNWPVAPTIINDDPRLGVNQLLEADMVYIRDLNKLDGLSDEKLKHLALILHHCYASIDVVGRILLELGQRTGVGRQLYSDYLELVSE